MNNKWIIKVLLQIVRVEQSEAVHSCAGCTLITLSINIAMHEQFKNGWGHVPDTFISILCACYCSSALHCEDIKWSLTTQLGPGAFLVLYRPIAHWWWVYFCPFSLIVANFCARFGQFLCNIWLGMCAQLTSSSRNATVSKQPRWVFSVRSVSVN